MRERPILFSAPMVRALLDGSKTQTRRIMKPQPKPCTDERGGHSWPSDPHQSMLHVEQELQNTHEWRGLAKDAWCGNSHNITHLWVREAWMPVEHDVQPVRYRATNPSYIGKWKPSIHMPRWASRITLEIVNVRVERLQDISEADAKAEGADCLITSDRFTKEERALLDIPLMEDANPYRNGYALLWESINGSGAWDANPWVWCISFKRLE